MSDPATPNELKRPHLEVQYEDPVEGACRFVIEDRFGITGARWSPDGAEDILKLRAIVVNGDLDDYMNYYKARYLEERRLARYAPAGIPDLGLAA